MIINTKQHLSDKADSFLFDKSKTIWKNDPTVNNLQDIFDDMHPYSVNGQPRATTNSYGVIILSDDEDLKGNGNNSVMTNKFMLSSMDKPYATYNSYGTIKLASQKDYDENNDSNAMTTKLLHYAKNKHIATTTKNGTIKMATDKEVVDGVVANKAITPNQLKLGINAIHKPTLSATETRIGTIRISSINDNFNGVIHNGFGISPYSLMLTRANETKFGLVKMSTQSEYDRGISSNTAVSPNLIKGDIEKLNSLNKNIDDFDKKYKDYLASRPKEIKDIVDRLWGSFDSDAFIDEFIPIGTIYHSYSGKESDNFVKPIGQSLNKNTHSKLFSIIGYTFGKGDDDNHFRLPDIRGLFIKMYGISKVITESDMKDFTKEITKMFQYQDDRIGGHKHAGWAGRAEYKWRNGTTTSRDWFGSSSGDYDNATAYTNDGTNLGGDETLDPNGLIGDETRPWNMPLNLFMRIK